MKRILVINPFGIGDVLFTTPVLRNIRNSWPDSFIGYWCNERAKDVLESNPLINRVFPLSRGDIKKIYKASKAKGLLRSLDLFLKLKKERFGIVLDYSLDQRYGLVTKLAGIKERIGFDYKKRGRFLTEKIILKGYSDKHVVEYYLELLKPLGLEAQSRYLELNVSKEIKVKTAGLLQSFGVSEKDLCIGIAPGTGASWGRDAAKKQWPIENFASLAKKITNAYGNGKLIILGDELDKPLADQIEKFTENKTINLAGKTSLSDLTGLIDRVDIFIANEGGPMHMASALGKKIVSFFGPVSPKVYGIYPFDENKHIILRKAMECSPCYQNFRLAECLKNKQCLEGITVEEAFQAVNKLLKSKA